MHSISRPSLLAALRARAGVFAQPDDDKGGDKDKDKGKKTDDAADDKGGDGDGADKGKKKDDSGDDDAGGDGKTTVPYSRFQEVNTAKRTAERSLATATAEITTLKQQIAQLQSGDQSAALKTAQEQVTTLQTQIKEVDDEFEDMLEVALSDLPKEKAAVVRDIPGGARKQFAWFNKHRASLLGTTEPEKKKGPKTGDHDKKPDGDDKDKQPSGAAKSYVDSAKPPAKGGWGSVGA